MRIIEIWKYKTSEQLLGLEILTSQKLGTKIVTYSKLGKIYFLSLKGDLLYEDACTQNTPIWDLKIYNVDINALPKLITGGMDGILRVFQISAPLSLTPLWDHKFASSISGFLIDDINLDNNFEIIAYSLDKSLRVLQSSNGSLIWGQLFGDGVEDACIWSNNKLSNKKEIIACSNDGTIKIFEEISGKLKWFKNFSNKIRCISYLTSNKTDFIICGGDDRNVHIIDKNTQSEIKSISFDDYIWKCFSLPFFQHRKLLISSYSFSYFNQVKKIEDIQFSSKLICLNKNLGVDWELKNINVEAICQIQKDNQKFIGIGTTKGELMIVNAINGQILSKNTQKSCLNGLKYEPNSNLLISCYSSGHLLAHFLDFN